MKIILLSGKPNSGKTTALNMLEKELKDDNGAIDITANYDYGEDSFEEFDCVFFYKGKTVAIRVDGDTYQCCIDAIVRYAICDVLVLTYSDNFSYSLEELVKKHASQCDHKIVKKLKACDSDNKKVCTEIIALL
jgi:tRNA uridine 5-carbamoylmethylation protein Kti12